MLPSELSDEELMVKYQKGSDEAFRMLYDRHSGKIFGYLSKRVKSQEKVNDLFQEVFVKIHKSKHLYNSSLPALPWLFSVTYSVMVDGLRQDARKKESFGVDFDQMQSAAATSANFDVDLSQLPEQQKLAVQLRYVDENTFEEIAEKLNTSPLNVRQLVSRGIKNLKSLAKKGETP